MVNEGKILDKSLGRSSLFIAATIWTALDIHTFNKQKEVETQTLKKICYAFLRALQLTDERHWGFESQAILSQFFIYLAMHRFHYIHRSIKILSENRFDPYLITAVLIKNFFCLLGRSR